MAEQREGKKKGPGSLFRLCQKGWDPCRQRAARSVTAEQSQRPPDAGRGPIRRTATISGHETDMQCLRGRPMSAAEPPRTQSVREGGAVADMQAIQQEPPERTSETLTQEQGANGGGIQSQRLKQANLAKALLQPPSLKNSAAGKRPGREKKAEVGEVFAEIGGAARSRQTLRAHVINRKPLLNE